MPDRHELDIRIAIIDSGVHATHPHVNGVAGGVGIRSDGGLDDDYVDRLGHGTAVTAAIKEKAPNAGLFAVRIFDARLSTQLSTLVRALDWAVEQRVDLINLSLGTSNAEHEAQLSGAVRRAVTAGVLVVAAREDQGVRWLPGSLPGVVAVQLDWDCPRDEYRVERIDGVEVFCASGYPRTIPGVPPESNLSGISFAVANVTGLLARAERAMLSQLLGERRAAIGVGVPEPRPTHGSTPSKSV